MDTAAKSLTDELSRVAKDLVNASHRLQKEFAQAPEIQTADGERSVPDPVKLVRRICAMEVAIRGLQSHCEEIADRRTKIAPAVIETQQENATLVWELAQSFPEVLSETEPTSKGVAVEEGDEEEEDSNSYNNSQESEWSVLMQKLDEQATFFVPATNDV